MVVKVVRWVYAEEEEMLTKYRIGETHAKPVRIGNVEWMRSIRQDHNCGVLVYMPNGVTYIDESDNCGCDYHDEN